MSKRPTIPVEITSSRYWRAEQAIAVLEIWRSSGEDLGEFAERHGLKSTRLERWLRRLGAGGSLASPQPAGGCDARLVPLEVVDASLSPSRNAGVSRTMEIMLANGRVVRVGSDFDEAAVLRLVEVLEC
jgi:hypothetical protein